MSSQSDTVIIGKIGKAHGLGGWMKLHSFTEPKNRILDYGPWLVGKDKQWQTAKLVDTRQQTGDKFFLQLADCTVPEQAQKYTNSYIAVKRTDLPKLAQNEYYWADLEGLVVQTQQKETLGKVSHLLATGGTNDVMVLKGDKERLIPFLLDDVVTSIDLDRKLIEVDWDKEW